MKIRETLETEIKAWQKILDFVEKKAEAFEQLEESGIFARLSGNNLDFDCLKRDQVLKVISALRIGKWEKSPNYSGNSLDYSNVQDGFNVRLWASAPPPSCQLVETEEEVPAQPARMVKKYKLVCAGGEEVV